ncbi:MAG: TolC family protein [Pirellulales bacterium]
MSSDYRRPGFGRWVWLCAGLLLTACCCCCGCARSNCCVFRGSAGNCSAASVGRIPSASLAETQRSEISPDVSAVRCYEDLDPPGISQTLLDAPSRYQALEAEACRSRAAANSILANLLEGERRAIATGACSDPCGTALRRDLLALRAEDERNRAAGAALELFYRLAEAEASRGATRHSLRHVGQALDDIAALRRRGLPVGVDASALERQRIELRQRGEAVARSLSELNLQLGRLVGLEGDTPAAIWPAVDWRVEYREIDVDEAVALGLATRADLALLRRLDGSLGVETLPAARGTLMQVDPMLGQPSVPVRRLASVLGNQDNVTEAASRRDQIALLRADRERAAADEIRQAAIDVSSRYREISLAKDMLASWNGRLNDLRKRREAGDVSPFEIHAAEGEVMRAEHDLTSRVVAWKIAPVRLRQAQGLLAEPLPVSNSLPLE